MSLPAPKMATYADLLALPEDVRAEILGGTVVTALAGLPKHSKAQGALRGYIGQPFADHDGRGGPGGCGQVVEHLVLLAPQHEGRDQATQHLRTRAVAVALDGAREALLELALGAGTELA
jgi:hypothetical protein